MAGLLGWLSGVGNAIKNTWEDVTPWEEADEKRRKQAAQQAAQIARPQQTLRIGQAPQQSLTLGSPKNGGQIFNMPKQTSTSYPAAYPNNMLQGSQTLNPQLQKFKQQSNFSTPIQGIQNPGATPGQNAATVFNMKPTTNGTPLRNTVKIGDFNYTQNPDGTYTSNTGQIRTKQQLDSFQKAQNWQANNKKSTPSNFRNVVGALGDVAHSPIDAAVGVGNFGKDMLVSTGDLISKAADRAPYVVGELSGMNQRNHDFRQSQIDDADNMTQSFVNRARNATNEADFNKYRLMAIHANNQANALRDERDFNINQGLEKLDQRQVWADAAEAALDVATLGKGKAILEGVNLGTKVTAPVLKQLGKDTLISGAQGAAIGGAYGGTGTMRDPNATIGDYAKNIATGAALGGGLGVGAQIALPVAVKAAQVVADRTPDVIASLRKASTTGKDMVDPKLNSYEVQELGKHMGLLQTHERTLLDQGLSPNSAPIINNRKAQQMVAKEIQHIQASRKNGEGGYIRVGFPKVDELSQEVLSKLPKEAIEQGKIATKDLRRLYPSEGRPSFSRSELRTIIKNSPQIAKNPVFSFDPQYALPNGKTIGAFVHETPKAKVVIGADRLLPEGTDLSKIPKGEQVDMSPVLNGQSGKIPAIVESKIGVKLSDAQTKSGAVGGVQSKKASSISNTDSLSINNAKTVSSSKNSIAALKQEALKYKSAEEFVRANQNLPEIKAAKAKIAEIEARPDYQDFTKGGKISGKTWNDNNAAGIEYRNAVDANTKQLTDLYNQAHAEAKVPKSNAKASEMAASASSVSSQARRTTSRQKTSGTSVEQPTVQTTPVPKEQSLNGVSKTTTRRPQSTSKEVVVKTDTASPTKETRSYSIDNTTDVVKKRGFTKSVKASDEVSPEVRRKVNGKYNVRSTAKLAVEADAFAKGNLKDAVNDVNERLAVKNGRITDQDVADSLAVAKRLDATKQFDQAQQIYDRLTEHGTASGQAIQAFSLLKNRTPQGIKFSAMRDLKKAGVVLTDGDKVQLGKLIDDLSKTPPNTEGRNRALFNVIDFTSRRIPTNRGDKLANFWRAGLLTAPKTTGGNILGNTTEALTRDLWANPIAVGVDKLFSTFTGKRTKVLAGGRLAGAKEGVAKGTDYLKTGYDTRNIGEKFDVNKRPNYNNKIVDGYVNGVYRWMGAQDQPFYYAAKSAAVHDLAKADGINLKLKGENLANYIEESIQDPNWKPQTFKTAKSATDYARYSVFQNETMLAHMAGGLKTALGRKNARWLADFIMPFTQVPSSVAMRVIDRTPVGIAKEIVSQVKNKQFDQRAMAEAIGNGSFGIGILGAGYALANSGLITGAYPKDQKERKLWQAEGKQEYSVKVGNRWYSLNYVQPIGTLLSIGKQVADDKKDGKSDVEAWNAAGATAAQSIGDQSFLQGINGVVSAINDPQASAGQFTKSMLTSSMPNFIRSFATASDSKQRDTKSLSNALIGTVPGLRTTLPAKQDMFGNDLASKDNTLNMYTNPFNPSKVKGQNDPLVSELRRLQDAKNGIVPTTFTNTTFKDTKLSDSQVRDLNKQVNSRVQTEWGNAIKDPRYANLSDEDKNTVLKRIKDNVAKDVKNNFVSQNNIATTAKLQKPSSSSPFNVNRGTGGVSISANLNKSAADVLDKYNAMDTKQRQQWFSTENDAQYQYMLAKYQNDKAEGSISSIQDITRSRDIAKAKVGSNFSKDTRDLYGLSKTQIENYLNRSKNSDKIVDQLLKYDQALVDAGIVKKPKFGASSVRKGKGRSHAKTSSANLISQIQKAQNSAKTKYAAPRFSAPVRNNASLPKVAVKKYTANKARISHRRGVV